MKNNKKIINKKTNVKSTLILFGIIFMFVAIFTSKAFAIESVPTTSYIVESNDTLWKIASKICKKSDNKDLNTQKVIYKIKELNNITSSDIYIGQELVIPIY